VPSSVMFTADSSLFNKFFELIIRSDFVKRSGIHKSQFGTKTQWNSGL
jgi:hypothetical protein